MTQTRKFLIASAILAVLIALGQVQEALDPGAAIFF